ncbi:unnamed protein product, partial [Allacma fusca]
VANELEAELMREGTTKISVQQLFTRPVNQNENLVNLDHLVDEAHLVDGTPDDVLAQEYEISTDYLKPFSDLEFRVRDCIDAKFTETEFESVASQGGVFGRRNQYRLPKLEFKNSAERKVMESFPPTAANYKKAIGYMKKRFGKDEVLVEVYLRELFRLVLVNSTTPKEQSSVLCINAIPVGGVVPSERSDADVGKESWTNCYATRCIQRPSSPADDIFEGRR